MNRKNIKYFLTAEINKFILVFSIVNLFIHEQSFTQGVVPTTLTIPNSVIPGDQNNPALPGIVIDNVACQYVDLKPGYHFKAQANQSRHAYIDPSCGAVSPVPGYTAGGGGNNPLLQFNNNLAVGTTP